MQDEKANVRRNAVPVLEGLLGLSPVLHGGGVDGEGREGGGGAQREHGDDFALLEGRCNDLSLSTRKVGEELYCLDYCTTGLVALNFETRTNRVKLERWAELGDVPG